MYRIDTQSEWMRHGGGGGAGIDDSPRPTTHKTAAVPEQQTILSYNILSTGGPLAASWLACQTKRWIVQWAECEEREKRYTKDQSNTATTKKSWRRGSVTVAGRVWRARRWWIGERQATPTRIFLTQVQNFFPHFNSFFLFFLFF